MTKQDHYDQAEMFAAKAAEEDHPEWVTAWATLALVHATLSSKDASRRIAGE